MKFSALSGSVLGDRQQTGQRRARIFRFQPYLDLFEDAVPPAPKLYEAPTQYIHGQIDDPCGAADVGLTTPSR